MPQGKREALLRGKEELCRGLTRSSSHKGENNITMLNISKMTKPVSDTSISQSFTMPGLTAHGLWCKAEGCPSAKLFAYCIWCSQSKLLLWILYSHPSLERLRNMNGSSYRCEQWCWYYELPSAKLFCSLTCIIRSMKLISLVKHFFESDRSLQYSLWLGISKILNSGWVDVRMTLSLFCVKIQVVLI